MSIIVYTVLAVGVIIAAGTVAALVMIVTTGLRTRAGDRCCCGVVDFRHDPCAIAWDRGDVRHVRPPQACSPQREVIL